MKKSLKIYQKNKKIIVLYNNFYFLLRVCLSNNLTVEKKEFSQIVFIYIQVIEILQYFGLLEDIKCCEYFKQC